jgi:hypothetical protein
VRELSFGHTIYNFTPNTTSLLSHILLQCVKFSFSLVHAFLLFRELAAAEHRKWEWLGIIYWTTALCEMWNTDGVVKRINPTVTAILHPCVPPCIPIHRHSQTLNHFHIFRYSVFIHAQHFMWMTQYENLINTLLKLRERQCSKQLSKSNISYHILPFFLLC